MTKFQEAINFDSDAIFLQSVNLMRPQIEHLAGETKAEKKIFSDPGSFNLSQIFFQTRFIYEDSICGGKFNLFDKPGRKSISND